MSLTIVAGHVVEQPQRELSDADLCRITAALSGQSIHVAPSVDVFRTVHVRAHHWLDTRREVRAIAAFRRETDCRVDFHNAPNEVGP